MLQASAGLPAVQAMLTTAASLLGYDLLAKCTEGTGGWDMVW